MKAEKVVKVSVNGYGELVSDLKKVIDEVPGGAIYKIAHHKGDRPYDSDSFTISFSWNEEL